MADITVGKLAIIFVHLDPLPPATVEVAPPTAKRPNQKAHMYWWFLSQQTTGKGSYSRMVGNNSSQSTYNRLQTVPGLMWIAEALGEEEETLHKAYKAALEYPAKNSQSRCAAFRAVIPWERISELIHDPEGWRIDPKLKPVLKWYKGWPMVRDQKEYKRIIGEELG